MGKDTLDDIECILVPTEYYVIWFAIGCIASRSAPTEERCFVAACVSSGDWLCEFLILWAHEWKI